MTAEPASEFDRDDPGQVMPGADNVALTKLLGFFDVPAFARRGQDVESAVERLMARCAKERTERLAPVVRRFRVWAESAGGSLPDAWREDFAAPDDPAVWIGMIGVDSDQHVNETTSRPVRGWLTRGPSRRERRRAARELVHAVERFNSLWAMFLASVDLSITNRLIDDYNRYYMLEKECIVGSPRLAARLFRPLTSISSAELMTALPLLTVPIIRD